MIRLVPYNEIVPQVKCPPKIPQVVPRNIEIDPCAKTKIGLHYGDKVLTGTERMVSGGAG
jgi:hypothetical protein